MDATDLRAQAQRWRALAERCDDRGARALKDAAASLERDADALEDGSTARFSLVREPPR
ncbi:MAG: hypothetical protein JO021_25850 [Alphaproteobacteria bacterium]|nr:hypothetical protein [Alphaproteobacteria bacterium]